MLRGWLALLAVLLGVGFSFAADSDSGLLKDGRWKEARELLADGRPADAQAAFEELAREYPREADVHLFRAISLLRLHRPDAAVLAVKRAIQENPNHAEARTLLGWIESEIRGDQDAAIKEYVRVVQLRPDSAEAYNNLGVAQKRKGELIKAAASFNKALEYKPTYSAALTNRGWIYAERGDWEKARRDFDEVLKLAPQDDGALYGLSQALRESRDYAGAQHALSKLISRSANFVYWLEWGRIGLVRFWWVWLCLAVGLYLKGRFKKARIAAHG